ncbi:transposase [Flagellimonas marinaquae]
MGHRYHLYPYATGYLYLVAIIDLHSRYVLNWSVSNSMDTQWCRETLEEAIGEHGTPEILNTDHGSQFTAEEFVSYVLGQGIRQCMDGKGRATDNAFIERLWRNVKYEKIYLNPPKNGMDLYLLLEEYFDYYNHERRHQFIEYQRPKDVYGTAA